MCGPETSFVLNKFEDAHAASHRLSVRASSGKADDCLDPGRNEECHAADASAAPARPVFIRHAKVQPIIPEVAVAAVECSAQSFGIEIFNRQPLDLVQLPIVWDWQSSGLPEFDGLAQYGA